MSEENLEIARQLGIAFDSGGFDAIRVHLDPEIEWHEDPSFPESRVYRGIEEFEAYARQFISEFSELHYEFMDTVERGEHVISHVRVHGTGRTSGASFDREAWWVLHFRDRKLIRCFPYLDRDQALEAAGLSD